MARAVDKTHVLDCDVVNFDLEDSVTPNLKVKARDNLRRFFVETPLERHEAIIYINVTDTPFYQVVITLAALCRPDPLLIL